MNSASSPLIFSSGMSCRKDFKQALAAGHSIGIDIGEMSANTIAEIGSAMARSSACLFIDSGAFGNFRHNMKAAAAGKALRKPLDFAKIFDKFDALAHAICAATDDGGNDVMDRVYFVMPDVVGDQLASLELLRKFRDDTSAHIGYTTAIAIVPIQGGAMTLAEYFDAAVVALGRDDLVVGIPSKAEAVSNDELIELLEERGDVIYGVHVLGAASPKTLTPRILAIKAAGYDGPVSADANRLRSLWTRKRSRPEAFEMLLAMPALTFPDPEPVAPAPAAPAAIAPLSCFFCGELERVEVLEVYASGEFQLDTCCEGMRDSVAEYLAEDPKAAAQWLATLGHGGDASPVLPKLHRGGLRRVIDQEGQLLLDWNLGYPE